MQLLVVQLQEGYAHLELRELGLRSSNVELVKDELEHTGHDTYFVERYADGVACSHGMCLSRPCLPVGQDGSIVTMETSQDQVSGALIENVVLGNIVPEDGVEIEGFSWHGHLSGVWLHDDRGTNTHLFISRGQLSADKRPYSNCHVYSAGVRVI